MIMFNKIIKKRKMSNLTTPRAHANILSVYGCFLEFYVKVLAIYVLKLVKRDGSGQRRLDVRVPRRWEARAGTYRARMNYCEAILYDDFA